MPIDPTLLGVISLGTMKKPERKRAEQATLLTMLPGPADTRAAFASVAVGNVARESVGREKRAAVAVITAVEAIVGGQEPAAAFEAQPALRDLKPEELTARFTDAFCDRDKAAVRAVAGAPSAQRAEDLRSALAQATDMLIEAIGRTKNQLFTADEAEKFDDYLDLLSDETRARIVKETDNPIHVD